MRPLTWKISAARVFTFAARDFYNFYDENPLLNAGNTGANGSDCIGIFAASNVYPEPSQAEIFSDYFKFFSQYTPFSIDPSLTIDLSKEKDPGVVYGTPLDGGQIDLEAYLDIESAHLIAPGVPITLYVTNPTLLLTQNLSDALTAMTKENKCGALNFSYYLCHESTVGAFDYGTFLVLTPTATSTATATPTAIATSTSTPTTTSTATATATATSNIHSYRNCHCHGNRDTYGYCHSYDNCDRDAYRDCDGDQDCYGHPDCDSNSRVQHYLQRDIQR